MEKRQGTHIGANIPGLVKQDGESAINRVDVGHVAK